MAKSTDNGLHWSEAENVTNTYGDGDLNAGGYPSEAALETGVHLASQGMDESVGVFYQMADFNVATIADEAGFEDYKNWIYVGVYGNDFTGSGDDDVDVTDLFFSEYAEGSGNNKYLEIYNGTGASVILTNYQIAQAVNGGGWQYYHTFTAGTSIADGDVWVITTDQADASIQAVADEILPYPSVVHHNGDDARGLISISGTDTTWIDIIGDPNNDPGSGWDVAGFTNGTQNHTLVRKSTVTSGNTDWSVSAGTTMDNSEWIVLDQDTWTYVGSHPHAELEGDVGDLPAPTDLSANVSGPAVDLQWNEPDIEGGDSLFSIADFEDTENEVPDGFTTVSYPWDVGNADSVSSTYFTFPEHSEFLYINDDNLGDGADSVNSFVISNVFDVSSYSIRDLALAMDIYFPNFDGDCSSGASYSEEAHVYLNLDGQSVQIPITGSDAWISWQFEIASLFNLDSSYNPSTLQFSIQYNDCGGNWGYGIGIDNILLQTPAQFNLLGYYIYNDNEFFDWTTDNYVDYQLEQGIYEFNVTAVYLIESLEYESEPSNSVSVTVEETSNYTSTITFMADVSGINGWDAGMHEMTVRGEFNGWEEEDYMWYDDSTGYYILQREITAEPGDTIQWKFKAEPGEYFENDGWEYGDNRSFEFPDWDDIELGPYAPDINLIPSNEVFLGVTESGGLPGDTVTVSVWAELPDDYEMSSFLVSVTGFGGGMMSFLSADTIGSMMPDGWMFYYNENDSSGVVITAGAGAEPVTDSGNLFNLSFILSGDAGTSEFVDLFITDVLLQ